MKRLLQTLTFSIITFTSLSQINYTVTVLRLRANADPCDGGAPFCLNAPQDPVFNMWVSDQGGNEGTYCWIYEDDASADYGVWIDIQNLEIASENNVNTSTITVEMSGFEADGLFSPTCDAESGDDANEPRQLAQTFDLSSVPHDTPYTTTVDIADIYYAEIEIHWVDLSANVNEISSTSFNVYPNPSNGNFTIQTDLQNQSALSIYDLSGRCVYTLKDVNSSQQIDLTSLEKGIYQGILTTDDQRIKQTCTIHIQ